MTDLLKIMFGTAALLFGWTLLEELPKNPPPPKEKTPQTFNRPGNPLDFFVGGSVSGAVEGKEVIVYSHDGVTGAVGLRVPPPNQFDLARQIAGPRLYQH